MLKQITKRIKEGLEVSHQPGEADMNMPSGESKQKIPIHKNIFPSMDILQFI